jgi:ribosomal protein L28
MFSCVLFLKFQVTRFKLKMKNICFNCGKGILMGRQHTHHRGVAGGRWKKRAPKTAKAFAPNLQKVKIMLNGVVKQVKLCTKCIKRVKKDIADKKQPKIQFAASVKPVEVKKEEVKKTVKKATKAKKVE